MRSVFLLLIAVCWATSAAAQLMDNRTISQKTEGWCSPAIMDARGDVKVTCNGVDPKALARLNELLDLKDLQLSAKIKEANEWAQKYQELSARLESQDDQDILTRTAKEFLHEGRLEEAGEIIDRALARDEQNVDRAAQDHFNRAEIYMLQFRPMNALPHYEKAHQYRPKIILINSSMLMH
jgi:tetratricopeptide (TPR) repeat protein